MWTEYPENTPQTQNISHRVLINEGQYLFHVNLCLAQHKILEFLQAVDMADMGSAGVAGEPVGAGLGRTPLAVSQVTAVP